MSKKFKRYLCILLSAALCFSSVPLAGFAATESRDANPNGIRDDIIIIDVSTDKERYGRDEKVGIDVQVANASNKRYENLVVNMAYNQFKLDSEQGSKVTIDELKAGEIKSVRFTVNYVNTPLWVKFIFPILKMFNWVVRTIWGTNSETTRRYVNIGGVNYLFVFYAYADSPATEDPSQPGTYVVSFNSNGGSEVENQRVKDGDSAEIPIDPEKENCAFIGWYLSQGYSNRYNFSNAVHEDLTLYAKWDNTLDTKDSDKDGLPDSIEKEMGTDPSNPDTDGDGVSDYNELNWLNYNPTIEDTDGNGTLDNDEDPDNDGLTNGEEDKLGANPAYYDSDYDGLSDGDEVNVYHTNPLLFDTDGDGTSDRIEISIGSDPLVAETSFVTKIDGLDVNENNPISPSASVVSDAAGAGSLEIIEQTGLDNFYISPSIPGNLGAAYDFNFDGDFESATITFHYDPALGEIGDSFQPRIYCLNDDGSLEELENQTVEKGVVSAPVKHFSIYLLLNKVEFDDVWNDEIRPPDSAPGMTGLDAVIVIDSSGSMCDNDSRGLRKVAAKRFVDKLGDKDRAAIVDFDSGAKLVQPFTSDHNLLYKGIEAVDSSGGTSLSAGIGAALQQFTSDSYTRTDAYKYVIFLTDGDGDYSASYTNTAKENDVVIYTIGLGSGVRERVLKGIANGTGGKYYFATSADNLPDIYSDVSYEVIDYTKDSNNDGISDYYTTKINDGSLLLPNGLSLAGTTDMYGEDCDDWDGDGLKNGEEIQVIDNNDKVRLKMISHPWFKDSDFDGYTDFEEVKKMKTPPTKPTKDCAEDLIELENNDDYVYVSYTTEQKGLKEIIRWFDWDKTSESQKLITDYFYDYASKDSIDANAKAVAKLALRQKALDVVSLMTDVVKCAKSAVDLFTTVGEDPETVEKLKNECNDARKSALKDINDNKDDKLEESIHKGEIIKESLGLIDNICEKCEGIAPTAGKIVKVVGTVSKLGKSITTRVRDISKTWRFPMGKKMTNFSNKYQSFMGAKTLGITNASVISVAINIWDAGVDIADVYVTYGKIRANAEAFEAYIDVLEYMRDNCSRKYTRNAAGNVGKVVLDKTWNEYYKQINKECGKEVAIASLKTALDITGDFCIYVKVAQSILAIVKSTVKIIGLTACAEALVQAEVMYGISSGCINCLNPIVTIDGKYYSYEKEKVGDMKKYMVQLAQSRIVGEYYMRKLLENQSLASVIVMLLSKIFPDTFNGSSTKEIGEMYDIIIGSIYQRAARLRLTLSPALPLSEPPGSGSEPPGSGSGGGGGGSW